MKKLIYLLMILPLLFISCSKDDDNGNTGPTINYDISDEIWGSTSITENGVEEGDEAGIAVFLFANGDFGWEAYLLENGENPTLVNWGGGPGDGSYTIQSGETEIRVQAGPDMLNGTEMDDTWAVDNMTSDDEMTWRMTDSQGNDIVMTLEKTGADPENSWK